MLFTPNHVSTVFILKRIMLRSESHMSSKTVITLFVIVDILALRAYTQP